MAATLPRSAPPAPPGRAGRGERRGETAPWLLGRPVELPPPLEQEPGPAPPEGRYRLEAGGEVELRREPGRLLLVALDAAGARALGFEDRSAAPGATLIARPTGAGQLTALQVRPGGARLPRLTIRAPAADGPAGDLLLRLEDGEAVRARPSDPA